MSAGYVESYVNRRIAQAYQVLLGRSPELKQMAGLQLVEAPRRIMESRDFRPMMRLVSSELRKLFSEETGQQIAAVLTLSGSQAMVLGMKETRSGLTQYGLDNLGPYKLFLPKKLPLLRRKSPVMTRISFEELCFCTGDPRMVYLTAYLFIRVSIDTIIGEDESLGK